MKMFMEAIERDAMIINLDPANDSAPYTATIDITDLITVEDAMETFDLGACCSAGAVLSCRLL